MGWLEINSTSAGIVFSLGVVVARTFFLVGGLLVVGVGAKAFSSQFNPCIIGPGLGVVVVTTRLLVVVTLLVVVVYGTGVYKNMV